MSDTDRVQRWRERMREQGKEPMTVWFSQEEKLRLEDLARTWRSSPSAMLSQALAHFHPGSPSVPGNVSDTSQLQAMLAEAARALFPALKSEILQDLQPAHDSISTVPVTNRNVIGTQSPERPRKAKPARESVAGTAEARVSEPAHPHKGGRPSSPERQQILALLAEHPEGLSAEQIRVYIKAEKALGDTLQGMKRNNVLTAQGHGKTLRYFVTP